jgi:hypothetical protein
MWERLVWMPFDKVGYTQAAVDGPKKPRLAIGVGAGCRSGAGSAGQGQESWNTDIVPVEVTCFRQWRISHLPINNYTLKGVPLPEY